MQTQQQQMDQMPPDEAQEYLGKLQSGKAPLPDTASPLESEMLRSLMEGSKRIRELNTRKSDAEKQVENIQQQINGLGSAITEVTGEMGGYARLLVSAEWSRRKAEKAAKAAAIADVEGAPENKKQPETKGLENKKQPEAPPAPPAKPKS